MKKVFYLLVVLAALFGCSKDEDSGLKDDVAKMKERLDAIEKGKTVINVEFKDTDMILTYSSGDKVTLPLPKGLNGANGSNGKDGAGIQTMAYNETTGILTITLTNGNVSDFKIVESGSKLTAVLLSDVNGSYLLTNANVGSLNLVSLTYNDQNQVVSMVKNVIDDRIQVKSFETTNEYSNGLLASITQKQYATSTRDNWKRIILPSSTKMYSKTKRGEDFSVKDLGDGFYETVIYLGQSSDGSYGYETAQKTYKMEVVTDQQQYFSYSFPSPSKYLKISDSKMIRPNYGYVYSSTKRDDGKYVNIIYVYYGEYDELKSVKVGDMLSNSRYAIENNDKGLISTITRYNDGLATPEYQLRLTYNSTNKVAKSEKFVQANGSWTSTGSYLAYEYNEANQNTQINRITADGKGSEKVMATTYDSYGNPLEIYALQGAIFSGYADSWFNPDTQTFVQGGRLVEPAGFRLFAKFEYDYKLKNFFGNSITVLNPILDHYKVVNALKRGWSADEYNLNGWITYQDYNEFGYPQSLVLNMNTSLYTNKILPGGTLDARLTYQKKK
jgi:hypothetical protein